MEMIEFLHYKQTLYAFLYVATMTPSFHLAIKRK